MKRLSVNKNDYSFENKILFKDLLDKSKALTKSIKQNGTETFVAVAMVGCIIISGTNIFKFGKEIINTVDYCLSISEIQDTVSEKNDDSIKELLNSSIAVANVLSSTETGYHFENSHLVDDEGNVITLNGVDKSLYFVRCKLDRATLENMQLSCSKAKEICLDYSAMDNGFIDYLPDTVEALSLNGCRFITNLNNLPNQCPNLTGLSLNANPSLTDLSFIYELQNLQELYLTDSAYVTEELLEYLNANNITTNISDKDIINAQKVDEIISRIIKPGMNDKEKIQAICIYILDNVKYDIHKTLESNNSPLSCVLEDGKGVCASYAYFTNVLLSKAGITSFEVTNDSHAWNIVKLDDKYYYIDTTNMDGSMFYNFILKTLNMTKYYMVDTENTLTTTMDKPSDDATIIPLSLVKDIEAGRNEKDIWEKYGGQVGNIGVMIGSFLAGVSVIAGPLLFSSTIDQVLYVVDSIEYDYKKERDKQRSK